MENYHSVEIKIQKREQQFGFLCRQGALSSKSCVLASEELEVALKPRSYLSRYWGIWWKETAKASQQATSAVTMLLSPRTIMLEASALTAYNTYHFVTVSLGISSS